jgi:hypothetical protein
MEDELKNNGRRPQKNGIQKWKTTSKKWYTKMEDDLKNKTKKEEDREKNGRQTFFFLYWKTTKFF